MGSDNGTTKTVVSGRMDIALEITWLLIIFLLPLYFNPFGYQAFYFAKSLLLQFGVCMMLGLFTARWFLVSRTGVSVNLFAVIRRSPIQVVVIVFGLLWVVSTVFSIMPESSFWGSLARKNGLISIMAWIVFFLIVAHCVKSRPQIFRALIVLAASAGMVSLFGILEFTDPSLLAWLSLGGRVSATDGNPLSLSGFISMVLPVNLALIMITWYGTGTGIGKALKSAVLFLAFALQLICLFLAQYAITILLFIPGVFIFFLLTAICLKRKATIGMSAGMLIVLLLLAAIILGQALMPPAVDIAVEPSTQDNSVAGRTGLNTLGLRVKQWSCAVDVILDSPEIPLYHDNYHVLRRLIGYGPEMLGVVSQSRFPVSLKSEYTYNARLLGQPENHYLYLAASVGLLGLVAFLTVLTIFFYLGFRLLRKSPDKVVIYIAAALIAAIAQYCVYILFNPTAILPEFMFWLSLALMAALAMMELPVDIAQTAPADNRLPTTSTLKKAGPGILRKAISVCVVLIFLGIGFGLTVSPVLADMKLNSALDSWSIDAKKALSDLAEASKLEPREAVYYSFIGSYAFNLAIATNDAIEKSRQLTLSIAAYDAACNREPYLSYWRYIMGDVYSYWAVNGDPGKWKEALNCYESADILMPNNAVILNKWALALMLSGDYAGARQKLSKSHEADVDWIQTTYYIGLLDVYERCYCSAGYCFVYPVNQNTSNFGSYIGFCSQLSLYGGLDKVVEELKVYSGCHPDDWTGRALLGIAEVYGDRLLDAEVSFRKAARAVSTENAGMLKGIITVMGMENKDFQPIAQDIADSLVGKIPGSSK